MKVWTGLPPYSITDHQTNLNDDLCIRSKWQWIGLFIFHIQIIVAFESFIFVLGEIVWNHWRSPIHHCNDMHYRHVYITKRKMQFITYLRPAEKTWDKRYFRTVFARRNCICWYCLNAVEFACHRNIIVSQSIDGLRASSIYFSCKNWMTLVVSPNCEFGSKNHDFLYCCKDCLTECAMFW